MGFELNQLLDSASILSGVTENSKSSKDIKHLLYTRLTSCCKILNREYATSGKPDEDVLEAIQLRTGLESLFILEHIEQILTRKYGSRSIRTGENVDMLTDVALGVRDMANLRTLTTIIFKWGTDAVLSRLITRVKPSKSGIVIIDLTDTSSDFTTLCSIVSRMFAILLPGDLMDTTPQSFIATNLYTRHVTDLLKPSIFIAWLPKSLYGEIGEPPVELRQLTLRLLSVLPTSQTISSLGTIISSKPSLPTYVIRTCAGLQSKQLLRQSGVRGLFASIFGESEASEPESDAPIERLEHVAKVLRTVPTGLSPETYYNIIIPQILDVLSTSSSDRTPPAHTRVAAFSLSRMLSQDEMSLNNRDILSSILLPFLHDPFLSVSIRPLKDSEESREDKPALMPQDALMILTKIFINSDPSPILISTLLTPIVPSLYSLLELLYKHKAADPALKETVSGLLNTWARISEQSCVTDTLWLIIETEESLDWKINIAGDLHLVERTSSAFSAMSLSDMLNGPSEEIDVDANPLDLRPDPSHFTRFLKSMGREDAVSDVFLKLLEAYREASLHTNNEPMKTLLYLQIILQMQAQLTTTTSSTNILKKPAHILSFVNHALEPPDPISSKNTSLSDGSFTNSSQQKLRFVEDYDRSDDDDDVNELGVEGDSDDEDAPGLEGIVRKDEMAATATNLLLSILEANPELSSRTEPVLNEIFSQLEPLANGSSEALRSLAREARMVLTARLASTSATDSVKRSSVNDKDKEKIAAQETYQRALKLLQDPILPVRAHGLLLLRELVVSPSSVSKGKEGTTRAPMLDPAFKPAVLSIFLESVQDDDSYIFLNAVQGLSAMVDGFGKDVLRGLIDVYMKGLDGVGVADLSQKEIDVRLRLGEALGQVIRKCGAALSAYVDILLPPLFILLRATHLPIVIRTSAISLLAQCVDTNMSAILPYMMDLTNSMVDLIQIETVTASPLLANKKCKTGPQGDNAVSGNSQDTADDLVNDLGEMTSGNSSHSHLDFGTKPSVDRQVGRDTDQSNITSTNSKSPPFRRSALHFLSLLVRAYTIRVYDALTFDDVAIIGPIAKRTKTVLSYVAAVDEDSVVRLMARECSDRFDELQKAILSV